MPRKKSLSRGDFVRASSARFRREHGDLFSLSYGELSGTNTTKASCVVSKKVAARAVDRNLIKRRCRSALREELREVKKPLVLIFYAKKAARGAKFAEVRAEIFRLVRKVTQSS